MGSRLMIVVFCFLDIDCKGYSFASAYSSCSWSWSWSWSECSTLGRTPLALRLLVAFGVSFLDLAFLGGVVFLDLVAEPVAVVLSVDFEVDLVVPAFVAEPTPAILRILMTRSEIARAVGLSSPGRVARMS